MRPVGPRYAVAVFPFLDGSAGRWGEPLPAAERAVLTGMLAALHRSAAARGRAGGRDRPGPARGAGRGAAGPGTALAGGAVRRAARTLLAGAGDRIRGLLEGFDRRAGAIRADGFVITHGEPHPGNVMRVGPRRMLIDWDTVGLGPPERDLWMVTGETGEEARRYAGLTGRAVDHGLLEWYRLRWALDDISAFVHQLRSAARPHRGRRACLAGSEADRGGPGRRRGSAGDQLLTILWAFSRIAMRRGRSAAAGRPAGNGGAS